MTTWRKEITDAMHRNGELSPLGYWPKFQMVDEWKLDVHFTPRDRFVLGFTLYTEKFVYFSMSHGPGGHRVKSFPRNIITSNRNPSEASPQQSFH